MIGDYLGDRGDFYTETLLAYLDHLSFKDMEFDKALRLIFLFLLIFIYLFIYFIYLFVLFIFYLNLNFFFLLFI